MCRATEVYVERGIEKGIEKGVKIFRIDKLEDGIPEDVIIQKLITKFELTEEKAKELYDQYSKEYSDDSNK